MTATLGVKLAVPVVLFFSFLALRPILSFGENDSSQETSSQDFRAKIEADSDGRYSQAMFDALYEQWGADTLIQKFSVAIKKNPSDPRGHLALGSVYERAGKHDDAVRAYQEALRHDPKYANAHMTLGMLYGKHGEHGLAIQQFQEVLKLDPNSGDAFSNLAVSYDFQGDHARATPLFREAIKLKPENVNLYMRLGQNLIMQQKFEGAIGAYEAAGRIAPDFWPAYQNLAAVYERIGNLPKAREAYERVLEIDPKNAQAKKESERLGDAMVTRPESRS